LNGLSVGEYTVTVRVRVGDKTTTAKQEGVRVTAGGTTEGVDLRLE